jgi:hypothetical protein
MITKVKRTRCAQPYKLPAPKNLGLQAALDLMRTGGALAELHLPASEGGKAWYIAPAGGRITAVTAARILERSAERRRPIWHQPDIQDQTPIADTTPALAATSVWIFLRRG